MVADADHVRHVGGNLFNVPHELVPNLAVVPFLKIVRLIDVRGAVCTPGDRTRQRERDTYIHLYIYTFTHYTIHTVHTFQHGESMDCIFRKYFQNIFPARTYKVTGMQEH